MRRKVRDLQIKKREKEEIIIDEQKDRRDLIHSQLQAEVEIIKL